MSEFSEAVAGRDRRKALEALRDKLTDEIDNAAGLADAKGSSAVASLTRQLTAVLGLLSALPGEEKSKADELADRRRARRAAVPKPAAGRGDVGGAGGS